MAPVPCVKAESLFFNIKWHEEFKTDIPAHVKHPVSSGNPVGFRVFQAAPMTLISYICQVVDADEEGKESL